MAIQHGAASPRGGHLLEYPRRGAQHCGNVHDLGETENTRPRQELANLRRAKYRSRSFPVRGRNARGRHEEQVDRQPQAGRDQHVDSAHTEDVADLMRIGDDGGRPHRHHQPRQLRWCQQRTFQVHVRVDQSWQHDLARGRNGPFGMPRPRAHARDGAIRDHDVGLHDLPGKDIGDVTSGHQDVTRFLAQRDPDPALKERRLGSQRKALTAPFDGRVRAHEWALESCFHAARSTICILSSAAAVLLAEV